ncbi:unnamed protein product [Adineta ricciae]|uniref:Uncharacterized protein n=4 Tax=Adineta ricciae TaxID=249248 RepID=A0A814L3H7_ADIRI|nr:unnamed protein product [Adineta ricciae]
MGCTSSKENTNPPPPTTTTISDNSQQLINDQFRKWLKSNRPKADEYVLNGISSPTQSNNDIDDYRPIVRQALDLLIDRHDIKSTNKLTKLLHKEIPSASPKKIERTIHVLKQTADKLRHGQLLLDSDQQQTTGSTNGEITNGTKASDNKAATGEPGIVLKEALEKARISFYKGKQAAIFANPNGGYDVRIIDDNDDTLNQDGNLLRSIIVTEVKMRPKSTLGTSSISTHTPYLTSSAPAPPPPSAPSKLLDEHEIGDDFRRSIDAALKGLESIYQPTPSSERTQESRPDKRASSTVTKSITEDHTANLAEIIHQGKAITNIDEEKERAISQTDIQPKLVGAVDNMNEIMIDTIESTTRSQIGEPVPPLPTDTIKELVLNISNEEKQHEQNLPTKRVDLPSTSFSSQKPDFNQTHTQSTEEPIVNENSSVPPVVGSVDTNTAVKSASHNVTYTEIIHSESHDGEQSRRFMTESYDEQPSALDDDETTSRKIITKSEFSNHPSLGEKIMEQSVQVITVKVRNETITTTNSSPTSDKSSLPHDTHPTNTTL